MNRFNKEASYNRKREKKDEEEIFEENLNSLKSYSLELNDVIKNQNEKIRLTKNPMKSSLTRIKSSLYSLHRTGRESYGKYYNYVTASIALFILFFFLFLIS